ncbi:MAG: hypothetical protein ACK2U9_11930, partial [Anaerolineae bacterium]
HHLPPVRSGQRWLTPLFPREHVAQSLKSLPEQSILREWTVARSPGGSHEETLVRRRQLSDVEESLDRSIICDAQPWTMPKVNRVSWSGDQRQQPVLKQAAGPRRFDLARYSL